MIGENVTAEVAEADPERQYRREVRAKLKALVKERADESRKARIHRQSCKGADKVREAMVAGTGEGRCKWDSRSAQLAYAYWKGVPSVVAEPAHRQSGYPDRSCYLSALSTVAYNVRRVFLALAVSDAAVASNSSNIKEWLQAGR